MTIYSYRCPAHGDFTDTAPFGQAPSARPCSACAVSAPRVYNANLGFAQGKAVFHDGLDGDGSTNREWAERTTREFKERTGRTAEPVGARWI